MDSQFKQLILLLGDGVLFYLALYLALFARYQALPNIDRWNAHWPTFSWVFFIWLMVFYLQGLYDLNRTKNNVNFFRVFLTATVVNLLLGIGFFYLVNPPQLTPKTILALLVLFNLPLFAIWRLFTHRLLRTATLKQRLLFIGLTNEARELIDVFAREPQLGYEIVAVVCLENNPLTNNLPSIVERLTSFDGLLDFIKNKKIDVIITATPSLTPALNRLLYEAIFLRVAMTDIISFFEVITHRVPLSALSETWFLENLREAQKNAYDIFKRLIDTLLALGMGAAFLIFVLPIALLIFLYDQGPIFYKQTRTGRDGKIFTIFKFRTMITDAEKNGSQFTIPKDSRITKIGRFLRLTRLDELPQAWNILKNEMSFVGPRPERPEFAAELQKMMPYYQARHLIKPGLTGWSQVNYGYADSLESNLTKLQYDLYYIKNRSFLVDTVILLKTVKIIAQWLGR